MGSGKGWPLQAEAAVLPTSPALPAADRDSTELQQLCRGVRDVYGGEGEESVVAACDRRRRAKAPQAYPPGHERLRLRGKDREHRHKAQRDQSLLLELCCGWHCDHRRSDCRGLREFRHGAPMAMRMTRHQRSPSDRLTDPPVPPWSPERIAWVAADALWLMVCVRFMRRAQAGGPSLEV